MKDDPYEEIEDLHNEVKDIERNFKKVLDIARKRSLFKYYLE